ncbi:hypothetical protein Dsin_030577 [Dipteronia sinensis]|uniref:Uncharacterized protein n=1 Tax=Dipteronia sinensis TaxID=43782 RepID=A0AAD9ZJC3_9ROSI|nr:hypothetical protein Dsin_030577 [Dipteronia sinensis]
MPCSSSLAWDSLVWHYGKWGSYMVKNRYHFGCMLNTNSSTSGLSLSESWWKFLWLIKVPLKVNDHLPFIDVMLLCKNQLLDEDIEMLFMVLWRSWYKGNNRVHSSAVVHDTDVVPWAITSLDDFREANTLKGNETGEHGSSLEPHWHSPSTGSYKINIDAAIRGTAPCVGIGVIVRD